MHVDKAWLARAEDYETLPLRLGSVRTPLLGVHLFWLAVDLGASPTCHGVY